MIVGEPNPSLLSLPWETYYMNIAYAVALRSSCVRRQVGAVITLHNRIISTGYNGTPRGLKNCNEGGCARCNMPRDLVPSGSALGDCLCSHAEENSITQAAWHGIATAGGKMYSTLSPCLTCAKMIINAGIVQVYVTEPYTAGTDICELLGQANIYVEKINV